MQVCRCASHRIAPHHIASHQPPHHTCALYLETGGELTVALIVARPERDGLAVEGERGGELVLALVRVAYLLDSVIDRSVASIRGGPWRDLDRFFRERQSGRKRARKRACV